MINISINPPDLNSPKRSSTANKEDLSINQIESVYEMIAEGIFDQQVPESDEEEIDTSSPSFELFFTDRTYHKLPAFVFPIEYFPHYYNNFSSVYKEPHSPPPRLA